MDGITPTTEAELQAADDQLKALEAAQAEEFKTIDSHPADTTPADERASASEEKPSSASETKSTDTPSEAEAQKEFDTAKAEAEKAGEEIVMDGDKPKRDEQGRFVKQKKVTEPEVTLTDEEKSKFVKWQKATSGRYASDMAKQLIRWDNIKKEETRLQQMHKDNEAKFQTALQKFNADVAAFQAKQAEATPSPERYEAFAAQCNNQATLKEAEAVKAEAAGDFDKAEALKREALILKHKGEEAKGAAEHVRKNPPLNAKKQQEKFTADQKTWIDQAAIDFPEFAKKDSEVQKGAAEYYRTMASKHPEAAKLPGFIYFCAERAALKTAADRVPAMEKELGELRTRVKEQDVLLNPTPRGSVQRGAPAKKNFEDMTPDEQFEALKAEAAQMR